MRESLTRALRELAGSWMEMFNRGWLEMFNRGWLKMMLVSCLLEMVDRRWFETAFGVNSRSCYSQVKMDDLTSSSQVLVEYE
jgi:hypothetical protein